MGSEQVTYFVEMRWGRTKQSKEHPAIAHSRREVLEPSADALRPSTSDGQAARSVLWEESGEEEGSVLEEHQAFTARPRKRRHELGKMDRAVSSLAGLTLCPKRKTGRA